MAQPLSADQTKCNLVRIWMTAFEKTARDYHGPFPRKFCVRAYEHATEEYLKVSQEDYGIRTKKAKGIRKAIENYIETCIKTGLLKDDSKIEISEVNPNTVEIKIHSCLYIETCKDLVNEGVALKELCCARVGCFSAAVKLLANIDCTYESTSVDLIHGCQGIIERV